MNTQKTTQNRLAFARQLMEYLRTRGFQVHDYGVANDESAGSQPWADSEGEFSVSYIIDYRFPETDGMPRLAVLSDYHLTEEQLKWHMDREVPPKDNHQGVEYHIIRYLDVDARTTEFKSEFGERVVRSLRNARGVPPKGPISQPASPSDAPAPPRAGA